MTELTVTEEHLKDLAQRQQNVGKTLIEARKATVGVGSKIWKEHGLICGPCNGAVAQAEEARFAAATQLDTVAATLATYVLDAWQRYGGADQHSGARIDNEVRS